MKRLSMWIIALLLVVAAFSPYAIAQQNQGNPDQGLKKDFEAFSLGELYVTGEKLPTAQEATVMTEVTAEQIEATHSRTVAEALAYVQGIIVTTGRKNEPSVRIHGLNQNETLVLIDGVPYYETKYGSLDLNSIPVDNIAKIDVQKGVSSVLYGPNAIAGVINIVTKQPTDKPSIDARAEFGDYRTQRYSVSHGMKVGMLNYWFGYDHLQSDGWYTSRDFEPRLTRIRYNPGPNRTVVLEDGGVRENSQEETDAFWAKVGIQPSAASEYYLNFHYITRDKGGPASLIDDANRVNSRPPAFSQLWRFPTYDNWGIDLSGQQKVGERVTFKGKLFYHNHVDELDSFLNPDYTGLLATSRYEDYVFGGSLLSEIKVAPIDTLRFSFRYLKDNHEERADTYLPYQEDVSYTGSVGVENELNPMKNLSIVAGLSYDWWDVTKAQNTITNSSGNFVRIDNFRTPDDSEWSPMAGATYTFSDGTRVFGSWARKIRFPTLQYLYSSNSGNPDLKPEKSYNYVLGVSRGITRYARGEASFFAYDISDMIVRPSADTTARYQNVGKVFSYGFEVGGEVFPTNDLSFRVGYTYINATNETSGSPTERVLGIPVHKVDLGVKYLVPVVKVGVDLTGLYVSQIWGQLPSIDRPGDRALKTGDYFIVNAKVSKVFYKGFEAYFVANNIFDKNYEQEVGFPASGMNLFAGIKYSY
jgi:iron complex outermembrane recepter protein